MPAIVGPVNIGNAGGIVTFGDVFYISPKETSKSASGSGAGNTGNFIITNNGLSATNTLDPDIADQNNAANA
ncbi:spore germination protein [Priestia abyssalis]|uniref:spore germination protein n=1 Tax=Priestia abyssalis TaxID=1221450 RepID=UPI0009948F92|nr:spore germination protein [Priestia abyssalis]